MFKELYKNYPNLLNDTTRILSIGCGTGIDSMALNKINNNICYYGVDRLDWNYKYLNDNTVYYIEDINNWLNNMTELNINVICFPKSISELEDDKIISAARRISEINRDSDLYILVFLRANDFTLSDDIDKSEKFIDELINNGYNRSGGNVKDQYTTFVRKSEGIFKYNGFYEYPNDGVELCC
ncbi:MAG: class I SAM-dependent methyltransferase, partial [Lachnospiraceae bacterium]|nr:class I SAM-dependent methyltransferase [Lachnospiraceae bacterium]